MPMQNKVSIESNSEKAHPQNGTTKTLQLDLHAKQLQKEPTVATATVVVPPDGGWGWVVMVSSFLCNVIVDGIVLTAGLLLHQIKDEFNCSKAEVSLFFCIIK